MYESGIIIPTSSNKLTIHIRSSTKRITANTRRANVSNRATIGTISRHQLYIGALLASYRVPTNNDNAANTPTQIPFLTITIGKTSSRKIPLPYPC